MTSRAGDAAGASPPTDPVFAMPKLSIVVACAARAQAGHLRRLVATLASGRPEEAGVELVLVDDASSDGAAAVLDGLQRRHPQLVRVVRRRSQEAGDAAFDDGLDHASGEWVVFADASRPLPLDALRRLRDFLERADDPSLALVSLHAAVAGDAAGAIRDGDATRVDIDRLEHAPSASGACFRRALLAAPGTRPDPRLRADFAPTERLLRVLLAARGSSVAWLAAGGSVAPEPPPASAWALPATYDGAIEHGHLALLEAARRSHGRAPRWLQRALLLDLHWYFATDMQARAPTAVVTEAVAAGFHDLVGRVMAHVESEVVERLDPARVALDVRHALLSYLRPHCHADLAFTGHDAEQGLTRVAYHVHGRPPVEVFLLDGVPTAPAHAKYRSGRFFRRTLFHERIAWLPSAGARSVGVVLDGERIAPAIRAESGAVVLPAGSHGVTDSVALDAVRAAFAAVPAATPRRAGLAAVLKARVLQWLARHAAVRRRYARAWVFIDREAEADDNAEHQYRWTRRHHPDINAWFLLEPASPDWPRLAREGFRLVPPGLARRLLLLNCEHLVSSQPAHASGGFDRALYAGALRWRFTFLQHGVIKDDMSHWLSGQPFDVFVTSSPAEQQSIAGDDTPYTFTGREARRTGLPRHDRLLELARELPPGGVDTILLMPTWRGRLVAEGARAGTDPAAFRKAFRESEYASNWRALLASELLRQVAGRHGKRLVFMPHPDSAPYLDAFEAPAHVEVVTKADTAIQPLFCRSAAMVTDFSSVAFEMAYLRRPVVYFQFDRDRFFAGDHNWREGYFSYDRDGFGPVVMQADEVARQLDALLAPGAAALGDYVARMERALPDRDGGACRRVHEAVLSTRRRLVAGAPAAGRDDPSAGPASDSGRHAGAAGGGRHGAVRLRAALKDGAALALRPCAGGALPPRPLSRPYQTALSDTENRAAGPERSSQYERGRRATERSSAPASQALSRAAAAAARLPATPRPPRRRRARNARRPAARRSPGAARAARSARRAARGRRRAARRRRRRAPPRPAGRRAAPAPAPPRRRGRRARC